MRCCAGDEGFVAPRSRSAEGAPKGDAKGLCRHVVLSDSGKRAGQGAESHAAVSAVNRREGPDRCPARPWPLPAGGAGASTRHAGARQGFLLGHRAGGSCPGWVMMYAPPRFRARHRQRRPGQVAGRVARSASSASMALMCARMGPRTGEPGNARRRLTIRWRRARSSSLSVIALTSWTRLSDIGSPRAPWASHAGDAAHAGQHVPVTVVGVRRPLRPGPCLGNAGPGQFQPVEELHDVGG